MARVKIYPHCLKWLYPENNEITAASTDVESLNYPILNRFESTMKCCEISEIWIREKFTNWSQWNALKSYHQNKSFLW